MTTMFTDRLNLDKLNLNLNLDKLWLKDIDETLANSTTFLAFVGAGDLAVEKIRAARAEVLNRSATFDPKTLGEQAQASFLGSVAALRAEMLTAPDQIKALPETAQDWPTRAQSLFAELVSTAFAAYGELAGRGKTVVSHVRGEGQASEEVEPVSRPATRAASTASSTTTAAGTTAKKTAVKKSTAKKSTAKKATTKKTVTKKTATKRTSAASLAGQTLATDPAGAKSPAAKTLAGKKSSATPAAKKLAGEILATDETAAKTPAAKKLAAESTSSTAASAEADS